MPAHIKASLMGSSVTIPITNGKLNTGIWQGIYLCEHRNNGGSREIVILGVWNLIGLPVPARIACGMKLLAGKVKIFSQILTNYKFMTKGNSIMLAAISGAVLAALIANYLSTERGRQFLDSATNALKDLSGKATEFAKNNLGEIVRETTNSLGPVVKEKIAQQVTKTSQPANQQ